MEDKDKKNDDKLKKDSELENDFDNNQDDNFNNEPSEKYGVKSIILILFIASLIMGAALLINPGKKIKEVDISYTELKAKISSGEIIQVKERAGTIMATGKDSTLVFKSRALPISLVEDSDFMKIIQDKKVTVSSQEPERQSLLTTIFISWFPMLLLIGIWLYMLRQMNKGPGGGPNQIFSMGKSKTKDNDNRVKVRFDDVAGVVEAKEELKEVVDFLKAPEKFSKIGAKIPKGVLLLGEPGTGKTLLAKAVAGEAGVPFFTISGSDFVEMFVGVGASRVRDLFEQAKKNAPCIVFIDEIDAVGRQRGAGLGGGHDEREQTLNQLLVEMDGFAANEGIIIIAATNRPDILDPALLRPGRFDRQIVVDRPDVRGREAILKVHTKGKPVDSDVNLDVLARRTPGFTGADLSNLVNEAALLSARRNKKTISMNSLEESIERVIAGPERKSKVISDREKRLTAYHEGGHALIGLLLPNADPVHKVTIIPRGRAGGYTLMLPKEDRSYATRGELLDRLKTMLGGRVAEEVVLKEISTGASNDIQQASGLVRSMITQYGMSDVLGPIAFGDGQDHQVFLGRDFNNQRNYSEDVACAIDKEVRRYIEEAYDECRKLLIENIDKLHLIAKALIEKETLEEKDLKIIMETGSLEGVCEIKEANSEEKETSTTEEVKNAEVVEEKQADAVAKEPAISTTEKI